MTSRPSRSWAPYISVALDERDELIQCWFVAADHGGEAVIKVLDQFLLRRAT